MRLKTFAHLNVLSRSVYSIGFARRYVFTQPRPISGVRPGSWTISCGGFDSLPGVVILELCWA